MNSLLNLNTSILAYTDTVANSNPQQRIPQWNRGFVGLPIENSSGQSYSIDPNETMNIFDGTVSTAIDNTTQFTLTLSTINPNLYRFTWTGGTNPGFRTNRNLTTNGHTITMTLNTNFTLTMSSSAADFSAVVQGDIVYIPGLTTGDVAGPFNSANEGQWKVLSVTSTTVLQLARLPGINFQGISEVVVSTNNIQVQAFSDSGLQVGTGLDISNGFADSVLQSYTVSNVTPSFFEVITTETLPVLAIGVPTATGMIFYSFLKKFLYIEADQECVVQLNGDASISQRIQPILSADQTTVGTYMKMGPAWSLNLKNLTNNTLNVLVVTAE